MDDHEFHFLLNEIPRMTPEQRSESENVLEELQRAVEEHERILARQAELIARLRRELEDVRK